MSLRRLTDAEAADLQEHAHRLEELAEQLRCRAVTFRAVQDTAIVETSRDLREVAGLVSEIVEGLPHG